MKITIAFYPEEAPKAYLLLRAMRGMMKLERVRETERHPPLKHIYVETKKPESC